ncbi:MAG: NAD+ synthase [Acidimicrobiia bacterium]
MRLRVALAQLNQVVGDVDGNADRLIAAYGGAERAGCDVVAFPELAITGYPPEDLVLRDGFCAEGRAALERVAARTGETVAVVGFVDVAPAADGIPPRRYNAAAVCRGGRIEAVYRKHELPNYDVFDERRTFSPGEDHVLLDVRGVRVAVSICEDVWIPGGPVVAQARLGALLNVNVNGSPYHRGKGEARRDLVASRAREAGCAIAYVNQVGGQDELVFDGGSFVVDAEGTVRASAPQFVEDVLIVDLDFDPAAPAGLHVEGPRAPAMADLEQVRRALVVGTRDYVRKNGFTDVVIGLSGGVDSALVAAIAVEALGADRVHGVSMPSRYSSEGSRTDAADLATRLGIDLRTIPIEPAFAAYLDMLTPSLPEPAPGGAPDLTPENLQSRVRGAILMALSNARGWMVLTTGNKSETAVGYFTLYGDSVGGYAVIKDLFKTTVYDVCRHLNATAGREVIPRAILDKPPSAELRPDQRDDQSLPPYDVLDPVLARYVEDDMTVREIVAQGHDAALVARVARLVDANEYKRRQGAPGVRVTHKAFGKDRRLPITNRYRG